MNKKNIYLGIIIILVILLVVIIGMILTKDITKSINDKNKEEKYYKGLMYDIEK